VLTQFVDFLAGSRNLGIGPLELRSLGLECALRLYVCIYVYMYVCFFILMHSTSKRTADLCMYVYMYVCTRMYFYIDTLYKQAHG
jgi:hypothetical protein